MLAPAKAAQKFSQRGGHPPCPPPPPSLSPSVLTLNPPSGAVMTCRFSGVLDSLGQQDELLAENSRLGNRS